MGVMALFHRHKCFPSDIFLKKIGVLDSYFIYRYIIIKYGQVRFMVKSANYYETYYGPFSTSFFAKCLRMGEDALGGAICVIVTHF